MEKTRCNPINCITSSPVRVLLFAWLAALFAMGVAYTAQYGFKLEPCELCHWQRVPYYTVIGLGLGGLILKDVPHLARGLSFICALAFAVGAGIAMFHVGVEYKWWQGTDSCGTKGPIAQTIEEMRALIMNAPLARCDEPVGVVLGISMAGWNVLWSSFLAIAVTVLTLRTPKQ